MRFSDRLLERVEDSASHLALGIDPDPSRIFAPGSPFLAAFPGSDPETTLNKFCHLAIEAASLYACCVKFQSAFFESMGLWGMRSLATNIRLARDRGLPVILDAKRGDIGNTAKAYAAAYLERSSDFYADALTVNPYLGPDTLIPFVETASANLGGLFVLVRTSNPGSAQFQGTFSQEDLPLHGKVARAVNDLGGASVGSRGYSDVGAVAGATYPEELPALRKLMPRALFLLPGYGTQGGGAEGLKGAFNTGGQGAVVVAARSILFAYEALPNPGPEDIGRAMHNAAKLARDDIEHAITLDQPSDPVL